MALDRLKSSFTTRAAAAGLAGLVALSPMAATAQDAIPVVANDCGTMSSEICEFDRMADAAREYATEHQSVAILFHIGDDILNRPDGKELMQRAETYFTEQFAEHGITIEAFSSRNPGTPATGLTYYYGHLIYAMEEDGEQVIDLNLKEGIDAIPQVAIALNTLRQMAELQPEDAPLPGEGG